MTKFVRTQHAHHRLTVGDVTVGPTPLEVSAETVKELQEAGLEYDVPVLSFDSLEDAHQELPRSVGYQAAPDLAAGIGAISGVGEPVRSFDDRGEESAEPAAKAAAPRKRAASSGSKAKASAKAATDKAAAKTAATSSGTAPSATADGNS